MKRLLFAALALIVTGSVARAGPIELSDAQLDQVTAGAFNSLSLTIFAPVTVHIHNQGPVGPTKVNVALSFPFTLINSTTNSTAVGLLSGQGGFGILGPRIDSAALSRVIGHTFTNIIQR
jgi:hypothetical protein